MIILIPCYKPDGALLALAGTLKVLDPFQRIVLVDDGSGPGFAAEFAAARELGCEVTGYPDNRGKGHALKHGLSHVETRHPGEDVVCADSDGQHTPADIHRVAAALIEHPRSIVLGARQFAGDVPARSRHGNRLGALLFVRLTGQRLQDTQTGLRAYPAHLVRWLQAVPGARYEYELEVLLEAVRRGIEITEVPIATVYLDGNRSSHFRMPWDPIRICLRFVRHATTPAARYLQPHAEEERAALPVH